MNNLHYYEVCFYGADHPDECSYVLKTEISEKFSVDVAEKLLFGENPPEWAKELMGNCTGVVKISEEEAKNYFDTEGLTERVETEYGIMYVRPKERDYEDRE